MGATPAKYLFDDDFAAVSPGRVTSIKLAEHVTKLKEVEAAAFQRGHAQAQDEARADAVQRSAAALERIAAALEALDRGLAAVEARLETEAVDVAVAVARKLAPALIAKEPLAEITALATNCFRQLVATPHVLVRVNDTLHDSTRQDLEQTAQRCGIDSRLVVLGEPDIAPGDCRVEWADGGMIRDSAATAAAIEQAVARYVNARLATPTPDKPRRSDR